MITVHRFRSGNLLTPARLNSVAPISAYKQADETVNNSTTYQNDDEVFISGLAANTRYFAWLHLVYTSGATPDLKHQVVMPAGATWVNAGVLYMPTGSATTAYTATPGSGPNTVGGNGSAFTSDMFGPLNIGATAGDIILQWAQNTLNASNTVVNAGTCLMLWPM